MIPAKGIHDLLDDAVEHTTNLVEDATESVARKTMRYLQLVAPIGVPVDMVDGVRRRIATTVFTTIRSVNRAVQAVVGAGIELAGKGKKIEDEHPVPMRSDSLYSWHGVADAALGVVNGIIGDYLHERKNGLDLGMRVRHGNRYLPLDDAGAPLEVAGATGKLAVFVHGVTSTEWCWSFKAEEYYGDPSVNFGTLLQRDLGYSPFFVRYNSGRHISENGRLLAEQLEKLIAVYPLEVEELLLVGHSMGGLVIRSACHIAEQERHHWLSLLARAVLIGSPHQGAPLEKVGNIATGILRYFDHPGTQILAKVINVRSAGIKDLRYGYLCDEDWLGCDPDALRREARREVPLLEGVQYCVIASTITADSAHPLGVLIGDALVRLPSAIGLANGQQMAGTQVHCCGGIAHLELQSHPTVYEHLRSFCSRALMPRVERAPAMTSACPRRTWC